jgi:hypothetical protein
VGGSCLGSLYPTVDNPSVIAMYLQFVMPVHLVGMPIISLGLYLIAGRVPPEILAYLDQNERFAKWYVEVAWQRLGEGEKTTRLAGHWSRYGNLNNPTYKSIPVADFYDDWLGIDQVTISNIRQQYVEIRRKGFNAWSRGLWSRIRFVNRSW